MWYASSLANSIWSWRDCCNISKAWRADSFQSKCQATRLQGKGKTFRSRPLTVLQNLTNRFTEKTGLCTIANGTWKSMQQRRLLLSVSGSGHVWTVWAPPWLEARSVQSWPCPEGLPASQPWKTDTKTPGTSWHKIQNIAECRICRMLQKTSEILYFTRCFNMARFFCRKFTPGGALRLRTMLPLLLS